MSGYRQWLNGACRRAAVRWRWHELQRGLASARAKRVARIIAALATATAIAATIGLAAKLGDARAYVDRAPGSSFDQPTPSPPR
jgi:hypothetical protein